MHKRGDKRAETVNTKCLRLVKKMDLALFPLSISLLEEPGSRHETASWNVERTIGSLLWKDRDIVGKEVTVLDIFSDD